MSYGFFGEKKFEPMQGQGPLVQAGVPPPTAPGPPTTCNEGRIRNHVEMIDREVSALASVVTELTARLGPILTPMPTEPQPGRGTADAPVAPMANCLAGIAAEVCLERERLEAILTRLEP